MTAFRKIHFNLRSLQKEASQVRMLTRFFLPGEQTCSYREWTLYGCHFTFLNMTYFFLSCRNPSYFSTPNTRTDIYPPLGNLSLTGVRLEDHSSLLSFSPGRPVEINSVTTTRPGDTYSPFSAGVSVPKTSPPKVRTARWSRLWFIGGLVKPRSKFPPRRNGKQLEWILSVVNPKPKHWKKNDQLEQENIKKRLWGLKFSQLP